jgi:hypothetical protein
MPRCTGSHSSIAANFAAAARESATSAPKSPGMRVAPVMHYASGSPCVRVAPAVQHAPCATLLRQTTGMCDAAGVRGVLFVPARVCDASVL